MTTPIATHEPRHLPAQREPLVTDLERLAECGFTAAGSAVALTGRMKLSALAEQETQLEWTAQVMVSGTMASVGAHLLKGAARKLTDQFFACLETQLQAP